MKLAGRTLREWRAYLKMDKCAVAKEIGIHPSTYSNWEEKPEHMKLIDTIRVARVFKCKLCEINFFENIPSFKDGIDDAVS